MKLLKIFLLCIFILLIILSPIKPASVFAIENGYARITEDNTYLYKSAMYTVNNSNIYFKLERTYFVKILETFEDFYKVKYLNVIGYVLANQVLKINGTPNNPYPENITFQINSSLNTKLRTSPEMSSDNNVIGVLPTNNLTLNYIGEIEGEESIKSMGATWYYCYYSYENSGCILGYVYAPLTENRSPIFENTETFNQNETSETIMQESPSNQQNLFLVVIMCLPAVLIFIILVLPFNKQSKNSTSSPKRNSKKSKKDFYEID